MIDHIKLQSVANSLLCCPLSDRARQMMERIAQKSLPPILVESFWRSDSEWFGDDLEAFEEFKGPYQELDDRGLVYAEVVAEERGVFNGYRYWVTLRPAWDMPTGFEGLL